MKVLISGGGGYIGSHTAWYLREEGHSVVIQDSWKGGRIERVRGFDIVSVPSDQLNEAKVAFEHFSFDAAVIAVGPSAVPRPAAPAPEQVLSPLVGSAVVMGELCSRFGVGHVVFLSDAALYGDTTQEGAREEAEPVGATLRAEAARCAETILTRYALSGAYALTILRVFTAGGAEPAAGLGEVHLPERHLVPSALTAVKTGRPFVLWGTEFATHDGTAVRDFVHVVDVAAAVHLSLLQGPIHGGIRVYNVCSGKSHSVQEVLRIVEETTGEALSVHGGPACTESVAYRVGRNDRICTELGWECRRSDIRNIVETQLEYLTGPYSEAERGEESAERFGEVAVRLGFVTPEDIQRALQIQRRDAEAGKPRRLLGLVLLEEGLIDNMQLIEILKYYERNEAQSAAEPPATGGDSCKEKEPS